MVKNSLKHSIKDGQGKQNQSKLKKSENLGMLLQKHPDMAEVLYAHTVQADFVYEDMDFTIEEFSDITGADLEDLLKDLIAAMQ